MDSEIDGEMDDAMGREMDGEPAFGTDRDLPPGPINWNLLDAATAAIEWRDLDMFVTWLKNTFGLPSAIVPPYWHRHDELIWELSALHLHYLACYDEASSPSAPIAWMREFAESRHRLRDWVALCGTRLDRDRPTRQTVWPGEPIQPPQGEVDIRDRATDFDQFVNDDLQRRQQIANEADSRSPWEPKAAYSSP